MCGEHAVPGERVACLAGSSPHVRGTRPLLPGVASMPGIIPACAGNTPLRLSPLRPVWDHPRMCGEHQWFAGGEVGLLGSSPHVRGTLSTLPAMRRPPGIIPACAGNTRIRESDSIWRWDHPRMCGEHAETRNHQPDDRGSSPHVRGTPGLILPDGKRLGIIPACAGNTRAALSPLVVFGDHPRMCGEHFLYDRFAMKLPGSSPHVRGTHDVTAEVMEPDGIIPACAGNTSRIDEREGGLRDHPRMCGEHVTPNSTAIIHVGSSPHVRGTRSLRAPCR